MRSFVFENLVERMDLPRQGKLRTIVRRVI